MVYFTHGEPEMYDPIGWINQFTEFDEQEISFVPLIARPYFLHKLRKGYLKDREKRTPSDAYPYAAEH